MHSDPVGLLAQEKQTERRMSFGPAGKALRAR